MYLREMGSVELLSREGEIAIAKRIEAGRELMIGALCESPLTFEALTVWRDELNEGKVLLRDIIDLEAMYGAGPDGSTAANAAADRCRRQAAEWRRRRRREAKKPEPRSRSAQPNARPMATNANAQAKASGEWRDEAASQSGDGAADGEDFDDEGNLPLSAMEAALKPQVLEALDHIASLYKKLGKLQDASRRGGARRRRTFQRPGAPLQEAAHRDHGSGQVAQAQQQPHRSAGRPDVRHQSPSGLAWKAGSCAWPRAHGVDRADFLKQHFGNELDPNWARRVGRLTGIGWHDFVTEERDKIKELRDEIQALAQETRQSIVDFRRIVQTVQKGEREMQRRQEGDDRGQSAPRHLHRQEIHQPRPAIPRPDPGRQYRPDEGGR